MGEPVFSPLTKSEEFEQEREIILEEEAGGRNDPQRLFYYTMLDHVFAGTNLAHKTLGDQKTIKNITVQKIIEMYEKEYTIENVEIIITGHLPNDLQDI